MEKTKNAERFIDVFVNHCIDNIIKHKLVEDVNDLKSFANFALPLGLDDDMLFEIIGQGTDITYIEDLSDEERDKLEDFCCESLYKEEYPDYGVTIRAYEIKEWKSYLYKNVCERIFELLEKENANIQEK